MNIKYDKMRYQKNKLSYNLALIALVFNTLYIFKVLSIVKPDFFIGLKILANIGLMLSVFLAMEKVKAYSKNWSIFLIVIGVLNFLRTLYAPLLIYQIRQAFERDVIIALMYLGFISLFFILAGTVGLSKTISLTKYLESKEVSHG